MTTPTYGFICLFCGQLWGQENGYVKHTDPALGVKCRDEAGSSSVPSKMGPVAERPWGPEGIYAELRYAASYDGGYLPPPPESVARYEADGRDRITAALGLLG